MLKACGKVTTWGLDAETERRMIERHAAFVESAIAATDVRHGRGCDQQEKIRPRVASPFAG